jgi:hypothetical protein
MNIGNKSILAKLLATENVSVEHKNVRTAYFDLKERKIVLPVFKDMSADLYDLLIGHEVSHALNTPLEGWHDAASSKGRGFKSFLNIVEDARIERDIKSRYPGLTKNFYKGYRELFEMDFFGLDRDVNEYPLIDRINLHFKVGMFAAVDFTAEELIYVDKVSTCETWDDVVAVATELYELSKCEEAMTDMVEEMQFDPGQGDDTDEGETEQVPGDSEEESDDNSKLGGSDNDNEQTTDEEVNEDVSETIASDDTTEQSDDFDPVSVTDMNYRKAEQQLVKTDAPDYHYASFPKLDYKKWIEMDPWKDFSKFKFIRKVAGEEFGYDDQDVDHDEAVDLLLNRHNAKNRGYINMMVQQFEAKRKASQFAKARENKSGDLNMNKLWATQLTDDVFLSNTVVPDGKNHGMLLVIDFSGSMHDKMQATIEQLLIQVAFCKKVGIPFEVYSFTNVRVRENVQYLLQNQRQEDLQIKDDGLTILKLFSSDMSASKYKQAVRNLIALSGIYADNNHRYDESLPYANRMDVDEMFWLGGTPLAETVLLLRDRAIDFRRENNIEVLNTVFLTDGGNTGDLEVSGRGGFSRNESIAITENGITTVCGFKKTSWSMRFQDMVCETLISHFVHTTGSRVINYYLDNASKYDLRNAYVNVNGWDSEEEFEKKYKQEWLREGFLQIDGLNGFPNAYVLRAKDLGNVEELEVKGDSKGDLVRGFRKFQGSKSKSRKFLNNFIEKIA